MLSYVRSYMVGYKTPISSSANMVTKLISRKNGPCASFNYSNELLYNNLLNIRSLNFKLGILNGMTVLEFLSYIAKSSIQMLLLWVI